MEKILNITNRIEEKKQKEQIKTYRHKIETVQKVIQCSLCHFKCAMCGYHLESTDQSPSQVSSLPDLFLCENCRDEFEDFSKMKSEKRGSDIRWHNKEWINLWSAWLDYQHAIRGFKDSGEFKQLTKLLSIDD